MLIAIVSALIPYLRLSALGVVDSAGFGAMALLDPTWIRASDETRSKRTSEVAADPPRISSVRCCDEIWHWREDVIEPTRVCVRIETGHSIRPGRIERAAAVAD